MFQCFLGRYPVLRIIYENLAQKVKQLSVKRGASWDEVLIDRQPYSK